MSKIMKMFCLENYKYILLFFETIKLIKIMLMLSITISKNNIRVNWNIPYKDTRYEAWEEISFPN